MNRIQKYIAAWCAAMVDEGLFVMPDLKDALIFLSTEVGETLDALLRTDTYIRNNKKDSSEERIKEELADVLIMLVISANLADADLEQLMKEKLEQMHEKRLAEKTNDMNKLKEFAQQLTLNM